VGFREEENPLVHQGPANPFGCFNCSEFVFIFLLKQKIFLYFEMCLTLGGTVVILDFCLSPQIKILNLGNVMWWSCIGKSRVHKCEMAKIFSHWLPGRERDEFILQSESLQLLYLLWCSETMENARRNEILKFC
jgi:hypothetical protein